MASKKSKGNEAGTKTTVTPALDAASRPSLFLIDDETINDPAVRTRVFNPIIDGEVQVHGLVARDYALYPREMFAPPGEMFVIPDGEWSDRLKVQEANEAKLSQLITRAGRPPLDQGPVGYCWAHSTTGALMTLLLTRGEAYVPLSAYMVASIIKKGRDEGGWCGLSAKFLREVGVCTQAKWPQGNRSLSLDTAEVRAEAAKYKVTEDWVDLAAAVYDQNLTFKQVISLLLSGVPCAVDFNWWGHSVEGVDAVEVEKGSFGLLIYNSWGPSWGTKGFGVLRGSKAIPDGAVSFRSATIAA